MKLERLEMRRVPGLPAAWTVEGFGPGLNLVVGPNGSGKSSLCRSAQHLLWPDTAEPDREVAGRWRSAAGEALHGELLRCDTRWSGGRPALPSSSVAPCYRLTMGELLQDADATDRGIARSIRIRMAGGIDFPRVRAQFELGPKTGFREQRALDEARREHLRIRQEYARLGEQEDQLQSLRRRREEAKAARVEAARLAQALELVQAREELAAAEAALREHAEGMERLRGDEAETLDSLRQKLAAARQEEADARERRDRAQARVQATGMTQSLDEASLRRWERGAENLRQLEDASEDARRRLRAAEDALSQALDGFGGRAPVDADWLDEEAIAGLEKQLAEAHDLRGQRAGIERQLQVLASEDVAAAAEPLERATHLLRQWLAAPQPDPEARPSLFALIAGGLLSAAGSVGGVLFHPAAWVAAAAGAALLVSSIFFAWRRRREEPARARLRLDFEGSDAAQPPSWSRDHVQWLLHQLEANLQEARAAQQQQDFRRGLLVEREELDRRLNAVAGRRREWCTKLGLAEEAADGGVIDFARRLDRCRQALAAQEGAQADRRRVEEELRTLRQNANAWLVSVGEETVEDSSGLSTACDQLRRRNQEFAAGTEELARARGDLHGVRERLDELGGAVDALFERCGLAPSEDRELARRVDRLDAWQQARAAVEQKQWAVEDKLRPLAEHPELAELDAVLIRQQREEAERLAAREGELADAILGIEKQLELERRGTRLEEAEARLDGARAELADAFERTMDAAAGAFLLGEVEADFEENNLPPVLHRAQAWFSRFTDHRFGLRLRRGAEAEFVGWDEEAERELPLAQLSDGTRIQLLLAARLAFALQQEGDEPLPLFLDEALSTADPRRFGLVAEALLELVADGHQVVYLTANPADLAAWNRVCQERGAAAPALIDLGRARGEQAAVHDPAALAPAERAELPRPEGLSPEDYGVALGVTPADPFRSVHALAVFHLLRDRLDAVHALAERGVRTVGQWRALRATGAGVPLDEELAGRLEARIELADAVRAAWRIGHGAPVDLDALDRSGACGKYLEDLGVLAGELGGDARALVETIRRKTDERLKGFRTDKLEELTRFLEEEGHLDPREPLDAESVVTAAMNGVRSELQRGALDPAELRQLALDLLAAFGRR